MKKPVIIDADDLTPNEATAATAPPVPDAVSETAGMVRMTRLAGRKTGLVGRLVIWSFTGLLALVVGVAAWDFVTGLLGRNVWLGSAALGLGGLLAVGVILVLLREVAALVRLGRIDALQARARDAAAQEDRAAALAVSDKVLQLYAARDELKLAAERLKTRQGEILDADALMTEIETAMLAPLDAAARMEIETAARQVATATALVPLALSDLVVALVVNIRMIRRIAEIYGGRSGTVGSWRLLRVVASHLLATGAVAVSDDLIGSVAGGGALAKVSRRFGEGVINGALTARVGIAAMEVCRPMPFASLPRPRVGRLIQRALTGLFSSG